MKVVFVFSCIWWLASAGVMIVDFLNPGVLNNVHSEGIPALVIFIVYGLVWVTIFIILIQIFSDVSKGKSPFMMPQVHRLRLVAAALLVYAILEFAITCVATFMQQGAPITTINLASFIAAAVVFAFSFVFQYGVLLQEFSDDTV
ncbi:MAG: DUF2975 domain-containing protein [Gordonibacter sp.]